MVRQGPLVILIFGWITALAGSILGAEAEPTESIDRRPYKIEVHVGLDPRVRIDLKKFETIRQAWVRYVGRFVGAPWDLKFVEGDDPLGTLELETLKVEAFAKAGEGSDKIWILQVRSQGGQTEVAGREFDRLLKRLGPLRHRPVPFPADLPRELLRLALDIFSPIAEVGEPSGGGVSVTVQGSSLEAASPVGIVAPVGTVFEPLRMVLQPDGTQRILKIPFTYLQLESQSGAVAQCAIVSALRDPLTKRIARKNVLYALGIKPGDHPTRLQFLTRADKAPAAGYLLTFRTFPDGAPLNAGTTDRDGRITLKPGFADRLVILRLLAGNVEPMVELPFMPGEGQDERVIPFDPKPETVALEAQLDSLRDAVLDLVAVRSRLEARLKARADGEDWTGVAETLQEYAKLPPRSKFADRLTKLKEEAALEQAKTKKAILTKTAQAQVTDLQALIDRYLDEEVAKAYAEAVEQAKAQAAEKSKAKKAKKPAAQ